ncbi:hypothetical protein H0X10_01190, partial [Candidatus Saccharibacteria bacterium]|nr:hypothetical protein [Candidatus Saccharibacteria bacterium]
MVLLNEVKQGKKSFTKHRIKIIRAASRSAVYYSLQNRYRQRRRLFIGFETLSIVSVIVLSIFLQTYLQISPPTYTLNDPVYSLVGDSRDDTAQYLTKDEKTGKFSFALPKAEQGEEASAHTGRIADAYQASLPLKASEGVSYTDTKSNIAIGLVPQFKTGEGRKVDGDHIVYPAGSNSQLVYTLKYNGLKEDIIIHEPVTGSGALEHGFELVLPSGVEARLDDQGNIGIYSSDPTLFGNISFGSDEDRAKVDKARENGDKTNLVVTIPSPIVKDATGQEYTDKASFTLGDKRTKQATEANTQDNLPEEVKAQMQTKTTQNVYDLTIQSKDLKELKYPISIDPTIQTSSGSDFNKVTQENGVEVDNTN